MHDFEPRKREGQRGLIRLTKSALCGIIIPYRVLIYTLFTNPEPKSLYYITDAAGSADAADRHNTEGMVHSTVETKVLIIEDDSNIAQLLQLYLEKEGFDTRMALDGGKGLELFKSFEPDLVLLDIMLPVVDGWTICRKIRETSQVPIIMLTAKGETMDRVTGLEMGADDYIVKPFEMKEVLARIHAVLRRTMSEEEQNKVLTFDKLVINLDSYELIVDGKRVDTPPKEMELLYHLASAPNRVFTRNQLLDEVWGFDYFGDSRTVDVHIKRLREKLEGVSEKWSLATVWGVGYKFKVEE